jgi:hypothetical protein
MSAPQAAVATAAPAAAAARPRVRLAVGAEGDVLERDAERAADGIFARRPVAGRGSLRLVGTPRTAGYAPASVNDTLAEGGSPLEPALRGRMEERFGHDLARVRIHHGTNADRSARELRTSAYTAGHAIVFRTGRYAPETPAGRHLLAHELAHVVQQRSAEPAAAPVVQREGRSARGFFANLFQFWDYSKETLDAYLKVLATTQRIEDDDDSDDKARQIVAEWKADKSRYALTPPLKVLLVREMLSGAVLGSDQDAIIDLLEGTKSAELAALFAGGPAPLTYAEILARFGTRKPRLELFEKRVLRSLPELKTPAATDARSAQQRLDDVEKQYGVAFKELALSFELAPGHLYSSVPVDLTVPRDGLTVQVSLTRERLRFSLRPALLIDVAWPLANAELNGFTLTFAGLKPKLEINGGMDLISNVAQSQVEQYLQGLLAGTRFADPGYDPSHDPQLIGEVLDDSLTGDVRRVKYNFEKNQDPSAKESKLPGQVSAPSITLDLVHAKGMPAPAEGWGVVVAPGTPFRLSIDLEASGAELKEKNARLRLLTIKSGGIFVYKGSEKIVGVSGIEMGPDFAVRLLGVVAYVDLKELLKREYPGRASEFAAGVFGALDAMGDLLKMFSDEPPTNSALAVGSKVAEMLFGSAVQRMVDDSWDQIKGALGVSDEQIRRFFGLPKR